VMSIGKCIVLVLLVGYAWASVGCLNPSGKAVDWWVMLKVPYLPDSTDPVASTGYAYAYADANSPYLDYFAQSLNNATSNPLKNTLNQIINADPSKVGWLMYNDESPDGSTHSSYGHTKGDVAFDDNTGFWLIHSVPRWPEAPPASYDYPDKEKSYGQSFLCGTFVLNYFDQIAEQFLLNKPYVYSSSMTSYQETALPHMVDVLNKDFNTKTPTASTINIVTKGGVQLRTFAKNGAWNMSLYEDLAEPGIKSGMLVETWQNGSGGKMPSFCTPEYAYDSINVRELTINSEVSWPETKDHSKWGISYDISNWVCIGDINRMYSQNSRGGGTYCFQNSHLYQTILGMISAADYC